MSSSHGHSSSRHASHSSSASRHPAPSKRSTAHRGMDTVPENDVLPSGSRAPDYRSTRLSGAEGQQLMIRGQKQQSTHASRASENEEGDVRGFSRKEVSYGAGGVKHRSDGGRGESSASKSRTQGPYTDSFGSTRVRTINEDDDDEKTITRDDTKNSRHTMVPYEPARSGTHGEKTVTRDDTKNSRHTMIPHESARSATRDTHGEKTVTRDDTKNSRHTMVPHESARSVTRDERTVTRNDSNNRRTMVPYESARSVTHDERTVTRDDNNNRRTMVPYESARSVTRDERTVTRNDNNNRRTMVPYESARSVTRPSAPSNHGASSSSRTNSRAVGPQVQSIREPSSSSSSRTTAELKQRVEQLEDEKTRRLERQVEKLGDQVAQMQMGRSAAPAIFVPAPAYCACEYCLYGAGYRCFDGY